MKALRRPIALLAIVFALSAAPLVSFAQDAAVADDAGTPGELDAAPSLAADAGVVAAETAVQSDPEKDPVGFAKSTYDMITKKDYWAFASMLLIGLVFVVRKVLSKWEKAKKWATGDRWGVLTVVGLAFVAGTAHAILAGGIDAIGIDLLWTQAKIAVASIGGFTAVKKLIKGDQGDGEATA